MMANEFIWCKTYLALERLEEVTWSHSFVYIGAKYVGIYMSHRITNLVKLEHSSENVWQFATD